MSSAKKGKLFYLIFFSIGVLSLPVGLFLIGHLSGILNSLENTLCDLGWCGDELLWASQFLFPFLICSILLAVVLYFKERSFAFALKFFVISFAAISLLFFGGLSFLYLVQPPFTFLPYSPFSYFLLILLILFIVGLIAFKEHPLFGFAIRAFAISFAVLLLATSAWFFGMMYVAYELGEASTSASIYITSGAETITIYLPALLDANGSVLKMYKTPTITDNVTAMIIDTEKGIALKISGSGTGKIEIRMNEKHGRLKDEAMEEFLKKFTISMSNYTPSLTPPATVDAWVYSDGEVEQLSFSFIVDPGGGRALSIGTRESVGIAPQNGAVNIERTSLSKGWQAVKLNAGFLMYD